MHTGFSFKKRLGFAGHPPLRSPFQDPLLRLATVGFCIFLGVYAPQSFLPTLEQAFHASKVQVSLTIGVTTLAVALCAPVAGLVAERFPKPRLIQVGLIGLALSTLLAASAGTLPMLLDWRFLQGLFAALVYVVTLAYVTETSAKGNAAAAMSAFVSGTVLGGFSGRFLSGLMSALNDWHGAFVLLGGLGLIGSLVAGFGLPQPDSPPGLREAAPHGERWRGVTQPPLLAAYIAGFNVLFTLVGLFTYVTFHLAAPPFRLGPVALSSVFFVYLIGSVVTPVAGRWIERVGNARMVAIALGVSALGGMLTLVPNLAAVIVGLTLASSGIFVCQSASTSFVGRTAGPHRALASGLYVSCYYFGGSVGAAVPGLLWEAGGWTACVALFLSMQALTVAIVLLFWSPKPLRALSAAQ